MVWRNKRFDCPEVMLLEGYFKAVDDVSDIRFWIATALCEQVYTRDQQRQYHVLCVHDSHLASPLYSLDCPPLGIRLSECGLQVKPLQRLAQS